MYKIEGNKNMTCFDRCSSLYNRDQIYELNDILTQQECNKIIKMAKPDIKKSKVLSEKEFHPGRTSSHVFLKTEKDPLLKKIDDIVFSYLKIPPEYYEALQVVNYKKDQKYNAHYDACDVEQDICKKDMKRLGLRYATFIIYLNDNFEGGETDFPKRNIKAKPKTGKMVLFFNLNDDNTKRRENSIHAGLPPSTGEKWMCNKWIRMKKIN